MLFQWAETLGMSAIIAMTTDYPRERVKQAQKQAEDNPKNFYHLHHSLQRCLGRVFFNGLLEVCFQTHVQVSLLAVTFAEAKLDGRDWFELGLVQAGAAVLINFAISCYRFRDAYEHLEMFYDIWGEHPLWCTGSSDESTEEPDRASEYRDDRQWSLILMRWLLVSTLVYLVILVHVVFKIVALFHCEYSVWNLSGCVDVSSLAVVRR